MIQSTDELVPDEIAVQNLALYLMTDHQGRGQKLTTQGLDHDTAADRELYMEWARYLVHSKQLPTPYEAFVGSLCRHFRKFDRTLYHIDWVTRIEPPDQKHPTIGFQALLTPVVLSLGLTEAEYRNTFHVDRMRFLAKSSIQRRLSIADLCGLSEFGELMLTDNRISSVNLMPNRSEVMAVGLNLTPGKPQFISPGELDDSGQPYLPPGLHSLHRPADARLFLHVDQERATRILIPCSEIVRKFYGDSPAFLQKVFEGAFRRKSLFATLPKLPFDGVSFSSVIDMLNKPLEPTDPASRFAEREVNAIPLRALRAKQTDGYLALEVAPPALGPVEIRAHGIVFRTEMFKTIFLSHLITVSRPSNHRMFLDDRVWPTKRTAWQIALPMEELYPALPLAAPQRETSPLLRMTGTR